MYFQNSKNILSIQNGLWKELAVVYIVGLVVLGAYALLAGQDANWDLQNYHIYAAYALLHWRYPLDVGPGGFQAYLNPLPYLPPFLARKILPPALASLFLAALQGTIVPLTWLVAGSLQNKTSLSPVKRVLATITGCTSATLISELGTSFADLMLATPVLCGVLALLSSKPSKSKLTEPLLIAAGLAVGLSSGLKLTNCFYLVGLCFAGLIPLRKPIRVFGSELSILGGFLIGFVITDGPWSVYLWEEFGNPIFPGLNTVFRSNSAALSDFTDMRFLPSGWLNALSYPLRIARGEHPTAELPFSDPRFLMTFLLAMMAIPLSLRFREPSRGIGTTIPVTVIRLIIFVFVSFLVWQHVFSIERYALALEVLAGVLLIDLTSRIVSIRLQTSSCIIVTGLALGFTQPTDFWHRPWSEAFKANFPPVLRKPAAFLIVSYPNGYWASILPSASRFYGIVPIGLATGGVLQAQLVQGLRNAPNGEVWTLGADVPMGDIVRAGLANLGYAPAEPCVRAQSLWWIDTVFCRAKHVGKRPSAAADMKQNTTIDFSRAGAGWIYETSGWLNADDRGTKILGSVAQLIFWPEPSDLPLSLEATFIGPLAGGTLKMIIDHKIMTKLVLPEGEKTLTQAICLPKSSHNEVTLDIQVESRSSQPNLTMKSMKLTSSGLRRCQG